MFNSSGAFAQKAGDNIIGLGIASINPETSVGPLVSTGSDATSNAVASSFNTANAGLRGTIASQTTISGSWLHMYSDNIGAELLFGIPPKLTLDMQRADGTTVTNAATVKSWTPVYSAGLVYNLDDRWSIHAGVSYLPVRTTATYMGKTVPVNGTTVPANGVTTKVDLDLNTTDYVIRLGYRF